MGLTLDQILYCAVFFGIVALALTIYGQVSFLRPKDVNGKPMEPTKTQKTTGWALSTVPWLIPVGFSIYFYSMDTGKDPYEKYKSNYNSYLSGSDS